MSKLVYNGLGLGAVGIASFFWGRSSSSSGNSVITPPPSPVGVPEGKNGSAVVGTFDPNSIRPEDFYKFGFPGPIHDLEKRDEFVSCWDRRTRNPYWVVEHITKDSIKSVDGVERKKSVFKEDEQIPPNFRSRLRDYFRSGYDRGHNAPAADAKFNQRALDETFYMTNISPQVGDGFNRDYWAHFEQFARTLTNKYDNVRIMTGSLFLPKPSPENPNRYKVEYEVIGSPPNVAVPTHFFKLIVGENNGSKDVAVGAFVLPNDKIDNSVPLTNFQVPVEALERASGLELLYKVPYYQKKDLCREVKCEVIVRDFSKLPEKAPLALPSK
ncbi:Piso0_003052 [Millerozyma farinosa CBS 7064]|uniref:Piso0_003052 protein n=1 Tax=Pichia sorbitophila (strain ATCC MYA-4447 / BCRC 22081 / CBS 7064 / NBRC 10061 / NRRL Y-12695) TaxID=559304 RepID=G8YK79_PICSO|nr:Piso0_003052 [Millerozyma farinosa CBS 7064]CCE80724.1 Piso0_003052 [Millerozyma farinosa CBS 7064]